VLLLLLLLLLTSSGCLNDGPANPHCITLAIFTEVELGQEQRKLRVVGVFAVGFH
jgi:hypothetical protein